MISSIQEQINIVDEGHFARWPGMLHHWTKDLIEDSYDQKIDCTNSFLSGRRSSKCLLRLPHQTQPLQIFIDDSDKIRLLRLEDARPANSLERMIQLLSEPELKRSLTYPDMYSPATQWIYASKGITLYVLDESKGSAMPLSAVSLYEPTTVDHYLTNLGGKEIMRFFSDEL